jgi:hypothetical protein
MLDFAEDLAAQKLWVSPLIKSAQASSGFAQAKALTAHVQRPKRKVLVSVLGV